MPTLKPNEKLADDLVLVHSVVNTLGTNTLSLDKTAQLIADELAVTKGYGELLIQLLIDFGYVRFVKVPVGATNALAYKLECIAGKEFDVDLFDLGRIDVGAAAQRLADQLKIHRVEASMLSDERAVIKQFEAIEVAKGMLERAERAFKRGKLTLASAQLSTSVGHADRLERVKQDVRRKKAKVRDAKHRLVAEQKLLQDMQG